MQLSEKKFHEWNFRTSKEWMDKHNKEAAK